MAILIDTKGNISTVIPKNGKKFTLDEMQKHVGGFIEHIPFKVHKPNAKALPVSAKGKPFCQGWCDEEGKLKGLAPNQKATLVFETGVDFLAGPVLLTFAGES